MDLVSIMSNEKRKIAPDGAAAESTVKVKKSQRSSQQKGTLEDILNTSKAKAAVPFYGSDAKFTVILPHQYKPMLGTLDLCSF